MNFNLSEQWVEIIVTVIGVLWALLKSSQWYMDLKSQKQWEVIKKIETAAEAAATEVYQEYVRDLKEKGAFKADEKNTALSTAIRLTKDKLAEKGVSADDDQVKSAVVSAVKSLKS